MRKFRYNQLLCKKWKHLLYKRGRGFYIYVDRINDYYIIENSISNKQFINNMFIFKVRYNPY